VTCCPQNLSYLGRGCRKVQTRCGILMSTLFVWSEKYTVKVASLDHQHQKLFSLADRLQQALGTGEAISVVDDVLRELVQYTMTHFVAEEALLRRNGYPQISLHEAEHQALRTKLELFQKQYATGSREVPGKLMMFLIHWLKKHILTTDRLYADFLNSKGVH
jgi:hemerythrin-like metal-binding protein